jgi:hypothetical protein
MLSVINPNIDTKRPKHEAEIIAIMMAKATSGILTPEKSTPNTMLPTIRPHAEEHMAKRAGNTPLANISDIFEQGEAIIERNLPKYRSLTNIPPNPNIQAFVQSRNALPITQLVRFAVLKLKVAIKQ